MGKAEDRANNNLKAVVSFYWQASDPLTACGRHRSNDRRRNRALYTVQKRLTTLGPRELGSHAALRGPINRRQQALDRSGIRHGPGQNPGSAQRTGAEVQVDLRHIHHGVTPRRFRRAESGGRFFCRTRGPQIIPCQEPESRPSEMLESRDAGAQTGPGSGAARGTFSKTVGQSRSAEGSGFLARTSCSFGSRTRWCPGYPLGTILGCKKVSQQAPGIARWLFKKVPPLPFFCCGSSTCFAANLPARR